MSQNNTSQSSTELAEHPPGPLAGQRKLYIAIALLAVALGYFAFTAFQGATVFYLTVDELLDSGTEADKTVRVSGKLVSGSFQREAEGTLAHFRITDGGQTIPATYDGILPDLFFNEHSDIVLEGYLDSGGAFHSTTIIVKCPSKYVALAADSRTVVQ